MDGEPVDGEPAERSRWWQGDPATVTALSGFFTGLAAVILVPGLYAALLGALTDTATTERLLPWVAVILVVPLVLVAVPRCRRFGLYLLLGMVSTALVVGVVTAVVLLVLVGAG